MSNQIEGLVAAIGESGSLVTDISVKQIAHVPRGESVKITFGGHETFGIYPANHGEPDATLVASEGTSGFVEIEIVGISLAEMLGIKTGTPVEINWT